MAAQAAAEGGRAALTVAAEAAVAAEPSNDPNTKKAGDTQAPGVQGVSQAPAEPETGEQADVEMAGADRPAAKQAQSEPQTQDTDDAKMAGPDSPAVRQASSELKAEERADTEMTAANRPAACQQPPRRLETHVWHAKRMRMVQR